MCYVICTVKEGLVSSEKFVRIDTVEGGSVEIAVPSDLVVGGRLKAFLIGKENGRTLIEFPRESSSGKWRAGVDPTLVQAQA